MKPDLVVFVMTLALTICNAQEPEVYSKEFQNALQYGAQSKLTLNVSVEKGSPVSNATARVYFNMGSAIGKTVTGETDESGVFATEGLCADYADFSLEKNGFYKSVGKYVFQSLDPERLKDGCWLPWNPTIPVELREIRKPIPMYATSIKKHSIPSQTDMGFDCEMQDWVGPHGKGVVADFFVRFSPIDASEYDGACRLVFSSPDKDGGFIRKRKHMSSEFVSEYEAPLNGYSEFKTSKKGKLKFYENNPNDLSEEEYLIFKSRIVRDKDGVVVSANYGKIYGSLRYRFSRELKCGAVEFIYYFNPNPNDRNLEFDTDMTKNLFGDGNWQMPFPRQP